MRSVYDVLPVSVCQESQLTSVVFAVQWYTQVNAKFLQKN